MSDACGVIGADAIGAAIGAAGCGGIGAAAGSVIGAAMAGSAAGGGVMGAAGSAGAIASGAGGIVPIGSAAGAAGGGGGGGAAMSCAMAGAPSIMAAAIRNGFMVFLHSMAMVVAFRTEITSETAFGAMHGMYFYEPDIVRPFLRS